MAGTPQLQQNKMGGKINMGIPRVRVGGFSSKNEGEGCFATD